MDLLWPSEWAPFSQHLPCLHPAAQALEVVREQLFRKLYKELPYTIQLRLKSCLPRQEDDLGALVGWDWRGGAEGVEVCLTHTHTVLQYRLVQPCGVPPYMSKHAGLVLILLRGHPAPQ